jgi:branched-chain amino acid transport system permease protein
MSDIMLLTITGLGLAGLYFLVASGLSLIYGLMGVLNFAHGAFLTIGAYAGWWVMERTLSSGENTSLIYGCIAATVAGAVFALLTELLLIRRLYKRHIDQVLVTVGLGLAVGAAVAGYAGNDARFLMVPAWLNSGIEVNDTFIPYDRFLLMGVGLAVLIVLQLLLQKTRLGLIIRAGVENRSMVQALGIDVQRTFTAVFAIGGAAAGLAGALTAVYYRSVSPSIGASLLLFAFIVVVIGGMGSVTGTALSAVVVGIIQQFSNFYATAIGDLAVIALLAIVLLTRPQGLLGKAVH